MDVLHIRKITGMRYHKRMTEADQESDEHVVARVVAGDVDAYAVLMQRFESKLYRLCGVFDS